MCDYNVEQEKPIQLACLETLHNGIILFIFFGNFLLSSTLFLRFIHFYAFGCSLLIFTMQYSIVQFIYPSPVPGHLGCFQFLFYFVFLITNTAINILIYVSGLIEIFIF